MTKVLICEDDAMLAADLTASVEEVGHRVVGVYTNARDALKAAEEEVPDVAFIDLELADGYTGSGIAGAAHDGRESHRFVGTPERGHGAWDRSAHLRGKADELRHGRVSTDPFGGSHDHQTRICRSTAHDGLKAIVTKAGKLDRALGGVTEGSLHQLNMMWLRACIACIDGTVHASATAPS